eukprot:4242826-Pyramimonas_sp.AAC.1
MGPRRARTSGGHEGYAYTGPQTATTGPLRAATGPRRAARGPRRATSGPRSACIWATTGANERGSRR